MKNFAKNFLKHFRVSSTRSQATGSINNLVGGFPSDFNPEAIKVICEARPFTMTSLERMYVLIEAVKYISKNKIEGDIVECGVWKGGSMMIVAKTLVQLRDESRDLYLFDTFAGMTDPSTKDIDFIGNKASKLLRSSQKEDDKSIWCYAPLEEVKEVIAKTRYQPNKIHFIEGKVETTIPEYAPERISLLRLDTDWYESTKHELTHLFPRLSQNGILIIDDYGHWQGAKLATDEYFAEQDISIFLSRIDDTGRVAVKQ